MSKLLEPTQPRKSLKFNAFADTITLDSPEVNGQEVLVIGPHSENIVFSTSHTYSNWKRGLIKRVAHIEHPFIPEVREQFYRFVSQHIHDFISPLPPGLEFQDLLENWLSNSHYTLAYKDTLRKSAQQVLTNQVKDYNIYLLKSFIKSEFYAEVKEPRIIMSRSNYFKAVAGPYFYAVENLVYDRHYIKHLTPAQLALRLEEFKKDTSVYYQTDYSSFEGSFTNDIQQNVECALWKKLFVNYPYILKFVLKAYNTNVVRYKRAKAKFEGSRMSGDVWTTMANSFTNNMLIRFTMLMSHTSGDFLVEGDDSLIKSHAALNWQIPTDLGFKLKCESHTNPNKVFFCSLRSSGDVLIPDIPRTLANYGLSCEYRYVKAYQRNTRNSRKMIRSLMKSKAQSLLAQAAGVPILQELALQQLRVYSDAHVQLKYFDWWERTFLDLTHPQARPITLRTRKYVEKVFKISVHDQIALEKEISKSNDPCFVICKRFY